MLLCVLPKSMAMPTKSQTKPGNKVGNPSGGSLSTVALGLGSHFQGIFSDLFLHVEQVTGGGAQSSQQQAQNYSGSNIDIL